MASAGRAATAFTRLVTMRGSSKCDFGENSGRVPSCCASEASSSSLLTTRGGADASSKAPRRDVRVVVDGLEAPPDDEDSRRRPKASVPATEPRRLRGAEVLPSLWSTEEEDADEVLERRARLETLFRELIEEALALLLVGAGATEHSGPFLSSSAVGLSDTACVAARGRRGSLSAVRAPRGG